MIEGVANRGRFRSAVALWLLLLAASPLTNPFSTLDLVPIGSSAPVVESSKTKISHDDAIAAHVFAVTPLVHDSGSSLLAISGGVSSVPAARHKVLRL